jgi:hypothetical protein
MVEKIGDRGICSIMAQSYQLVLCSDEFTWLQGFTKLPIDCRRSIDLWQNVCEAATPPYIRHCVIRLLFIPATERIPRLKTISIIQKDFFSFLRFHDHIYSIDTILKANDWNPFYLRNENVRKVESNNYAPRRPKV